MALGLVRIRLVYFLHEWPGGARKPVFFAVLTALALLVVIGCMMLVSLGYMLLRMLP